MGQTKQYNEILTDTNSEIAIRPVSSVRVRVRVILKRGLREICCDNSNWVELNQHKF